MYKRYWFGNDSTKGLEKYIEVLRKDTSIFNGKSLYFYQNGNLKVEGMYKNNRPSSVWKYYYESGNLKQTISYSSDSTSFSQFFYENGLLKKEGYFLNHLKDSLWTYYYESGKPLKKGLYKKNFQDKNWDYFFEDGKQKAIALYNTGIGIYTEYFYGGGIKMTGSVLENETDGIWTYYYENGNVKATGFEKNGVKNGDWKYFYDNDTLASRGNYINGTKQGDWNFYHRNGLLSSQGLMNEGLRDGYWKLFNEDGGFKADASLINGTGAYKEYYPNNKLKVTGNLKSDKNEGKWMYYYEDGSVEGEADFENGVGKYTEYYQSGEVKMKGLIKDGKQVGTWELFDKDSSVIGYYKLLPINDETENFQKQKPTTDNNPPLMHNDSITSLKKLTRYTPKHRTKFKPFTPKYGELKGVIVSANPILIIANQIPISIEYFIQERLGYEFRYTITRSPFLLSDRLIGDSVLYERGFNFDIKQKFYSKFTQERGMLYFAHELRFSHNNYYVKSDNQNVLNRLNVQKVEYAITFGDRVLHDIRTGGFTLDAFLGLGAAVVFQNSNITDGVNHKFSSIGKNEFELNPRLGFSLGYLF